MQSQPVHLWGDEHSGYLSLYAAEYSDFFISFLCLNIAKLWILSCIWILPLTSISAQLHAMTASVFEEMNTMDTYLFTQLNTVTFSLPFYFFLLCLNITKLWILSCSWILSLTFMSIQLLAVTASIFEEMDTSLYAVEYSDCFISLCVMNTVNPYLCTPLNMVTLLCLTFLV